MRERISTLCIDTQDETFIPARHYTIGAPGRPVRLVVLHTMQAPEKPKTARAIANWFASKNAPQASAHYCVDADEIYQCVLLKDVAWGAPKANRDGVHIEMAGYAEQSAQDWSDPYSCRVLANAAKVAAPVCYLNALPVRFVPAEGVAGTAMGITTHAECTKAFHTPGGHWDPGPGFPMDRFLDMVTDVLLSGL